MTRGAEGSGGAKGAAERVALEATATAVTATTGIPKPLAKALGKRVLRNKRKVLVVAALPALLSALLVFFLVVATVGLFAGGNFTITPSKTAKSEIPLAYLSIAQRVGSHDDVPWPLLAAIAYETTDFGSTNPYSGASEVKRSPIVTPPIVTTAGKASTTATGVGPLLLEPSAAVHAKNPQSVSASMSYVGKEMNKAASHLASGDHTTLAKVYDQPISKNLYLWEAAIGSLPIAPEENCAPPGTIPAATTPSSSAAATAYTPTAKAISSDIEYVFVCELSTSVVTLAAGPHATVSYANDELVAEAEQVSWEYSKDGTTPSNCNPFPIPAGSSVPPCQITTLATGKPTVTSLAKQIKVIEAAATAVIAAAKEPLASRVPDEWAVLGVSTTHAQPTMAQTSDGSVAYPGSWSSAVPSSQSCENDLVHDLSPGGSANPTGLLEPGPFSSLVTPKESTQTAGANGASEAWKTSPLDKLRKTTDCEVGKTTPSPLSATTWEKTVDITASEVFGEYQVSSGAAVTMSDVQGLISYLDSVTDAPAPGAGQLVPRLSNPPIAPDATGVIYPAVPVHVGTAGFAANVVLTAESYDKATSKGVLLGIVGSGGVPSGWLGGAWSIFTTGGGTTAAAAWAVALLKDLSLSVSKPREQFFFDWERSEGGGGLYNPVNVGPITTPTTGKSLAISGTQFGGGAAAYPSLTAELRAVALELSRVPTYSGIFAGLQANTYQSAAAALWESPWAAGHYGYGSAWATAPYPGETTPPLTA